MARLGQVVVRKKAIWSLRLRLHSGLRQRGRAFGPGFYLGLRPRLVCVGPLALFLWWGHWFFVALEFVVCFFVGCFGDGCLENLG